MEVANGEETETLRQIFTQLDVNGDGQLNIQELNDGLKHAGLSRRTQSLFQVLDTDNLGVVDWEHFQRVGSGFLTVLQDGDDNYSSSEEEAEQETEEEQEEEKEEKEREEIAKQKEEKEDAAHASHASHTAKQKQKPLRHHRSKSTNSPTIPKQTTDTRNASRRSWTHVQHEITHDIRLRQWERLRTLQAENNVLQETAIAHASERQMLLENIATLKQETTLQKQKMMALSAEADEEIAMLRQQVKNNAAEDERDNEDEDGEGNVLSQSSKKRGKRRRRSYVQRLNEDIDALHKSKALLLEEHGVHYSKQNRSVENQERLLLQDLRMLTKENEGLLCRVKERESEYKVVAKSLIAHHTRIQAAHNRHEQLLTKLDGLTEEWKREDEEKEQMNNSGTRTTTTTTTITTSSTQELCSALQEALNQVRESVDKVSKEHGSASR